MLQRERSGQEIASEKAARLPQLFPHVEYDPQKTYVVPQNGTFGTRDGDSFEAGVTLSQKLWDFSKPSRRIEAAGEVPFGHKIALASVSKGKKILKYGETIGIATCAIRTGTHVHVHNLKSSRR